MLTSDMLRVWMQGPNIGPRYLNTEASEYITMAEDLIRLVSEHRGRPRGELKQALKNYTADSTRYKIHQGLAKLLLDLCEFKIGSPVDPAALRARVFALAREHHPVALHPDLIHPITQADVLGSVAPEYQTSAEQAQEWLYADLIDNQVLSDFDPPTAAWLLMRYNVALAQGLFYRCGEMRLTVLRNLPARYKQLFKFIKFYRLMHTITGDLESGYEVALDGPASLFRMSQKYGLQMANFLPALLLCTRWRLRAEIIGGQGDQYFFNMDDTAKLTSHYHDATQYDSLLEQRFAERFEKLGSPWQLERETEIVNLKETVFIPDFAFHHSDGRYALMEIIGFWRPEYLRRKLSKLRRAKLDHLIIAVSQDLNAGEEDFKDVPGSLHFFKTAIDPKEILRRLEEVGRPPRLA